MAARRRPSALLTLRRPPVPDITVLNDDDAAQMRDFADRCARVARTAGRTADAETGRAVSLMRAVESAARSLRTALLAAAEHADPQGTEEEYADA